MNILIFSPIRIFPADAGSRIRIFNFTNYLIQQGHKIHYVYYTDDGISKVHFEYMLDNCDTFSVITREKKFERKTGNYKLDEVYEDNIHKKILELINIFDIDTVLINYLFYSKLFNFLPENIYKIIDTHDKFTDRYKIFEHTNEVIYDWHSYSKEDEAKALNRADMILAITDEEKDYFISICNENKEVLTLGHIEGKKYLDKEYNSLKKVGFIGGANKVNIAAINKFLEEFYITSSNKDNIEILIAGQICNHIEHKNSNIKLLGLVDCLEDFYNQVDIVINPLTFGTGQKIKSVEALSFGLPILSTSVGFEGIKSNNSFHKLNSLEDMVKAIDMLINSSNQLQDLAIYSREIFDDYCGGLEKILIDTFPKNKSEKDNYKVLLKHKPRIQKETYNVLINTYLEASKRRNKKIKENERKVKKYDRLIRILEKISKVSVIKKPLLKYKLYKDLIKESYSR